MKVFLLTQLSTRPSPAARKVQKSTTKSKGQVSDIMVQMSDRLGECDHLAFVLFEDGDWLLENGSGLPDWRNQAVVALA